MGKSDRLRPSQTSYSFQFNAACRPSNAASGNRLKTSGQSASDGALLLVGDLACNSATAGQCLNPPCPDCTKSLILRGFCAQQFAQRQPFSNPPSRQKRPRATSAANRTTYSEI